MSQRDRSLITLLVTQGGGAGRTCKTECLGTAGADASPSLLQALAVLVGYSKQDLWRVLKPFLPCSWNTVNWYKSLLK